MMKENEMIFGTRAVIEALQAGKEIDKVLMKRDFQGELARELFALAGTAGVPLQRVPQAKLDRLTRKNHQGVIAFIPAVGYQRLEDIVPFVYEAGKTPFVVLLDGITDVRNFGAIARSCECAGTDAIVIPARNSVTVNADAVKTSAGALHTLPVCRENSITEAIRFLKNCGLRVIAASEKGAKAYTEVDYTTPVAIVVGAEDCGVATDNLRLCDETVCIPLAGTIASLNVSAATAVLAFEVVRQRNAAYQQEIHQ
jgi:23S rRNA (guanosine2251-2'-O)-methyltransferase